MRRYTGFLIAILLFSLAALSVSAAQIEVTFLNQDPDPAEPGEYVELRYHIENIGVEDIYDTKIEIEPLYPFMFDSSEDRVKIIPKLSSEIEGKKARVAKFRVRIDENAIEGDYNLKVIVSSASYKGQMIREDKIVIKSREMVIVLESAEVSPQKPKPGETMLVSMKLRNLAFSPLYDVKVKLELKDLSISPISSTSEKILDKLPPQSEEIVQFGLAVDADAALKVHKIPVRIEFKDKFNNLHVVESTFGVQVFAPPEYILNLEDSKVYVTKQKGEVIISLSNIGVSDINFVTVELLASENYEVLSNPKLYLGNLESDDYETAEFEIYAKSAPDNLIQLEVKMGFKDSYNKNYEELIKIPLKIYSRSEASKLGLIKSRNIIRPLIVLIILGVAGYIGYRRWIKKKKG